MKGIHFKIFCLCLFGSLLLAAVSGFSQTTVTNPDTVLSKPTPPPPPPPPVATLSWQTVVNNGVTVPGDTRKFNSYNQPSVNMYGLVVFRARSKGGTSGEPAHGVFLRDMHALTPLTTLFDRTTSVPQPNNLSMNFTEPPSFPRIDMWSSTVASRGGHAPVWEYQTGTDPVTQLALITRAGTTGIYTNPFGSLITGEDNLGMDPEFNFFRVPEATTGDVKFDVFPGAPAVTNGNMIVFKGNYSVPDLSDPSGAATIGKTGVYYRTLTDTPLSDGNGNVLGEAGGGNKLVKLIANSDTMIPGSKNVPFGSTAPPTAVGWNAVFAGFDNEDAPTKGGIYLAKLNGPGPTPQLTPLVQIGDPVPGQKDPSAKFNKLGEAVSYDGRFVAFWGAWGDETVGLILQCPTDGNKARVAYCKLLYNGDGVNAGRVSSDGFHTVVPKNQGIFVRDTNKGGITWAVATTTNGEFSDFVNWNFSGKVPPPPEGPTPGQIAALGGSGSGEGGGSAEGGGSGEGGGMEGGEEDGEPARWRSGSFVAVSGMVESQTKLGNPYIAFKARTGSVVNGVYQAPTDGIYLRKVDVGPAAKVVPFPTPVVETGMHGTLFDPGAVSPTTGGYLPITSMGIERDGFRGSNLVINIGMANTANEGWAGIYLTNVPRLDPKK